MTVGEITRALEAFAPLDIQESWDNSGLLIGSPQDPVHGVLVGFDCTPELIEEAVEKGCDMVVTHHPLIFKGIRRINSGDPVGAAVMKAVQKGVAVYAAHTTADKVIGGVSGAMARRLDLKDVEFLEPGPEGFGLGLVGNWAEPKTGKEALSFVKERFGLRSSAVPSPWKAPSAGWRSWVAAEAVKLNRPLGPAPSCTLRRTFLITISLPRKGLWSWISAILRAKWRLWTFSWHR